MRVGLGTRQQRQVQRRTQRPPVLQQCEKSADRMNHFPRLNETHVNRGDVESYRVDCTALSLNCSQLINQLKLRMIENCSRTH